MAAKNENSVPDLEKKNYTITDFTPFNYFGSKTYSGSKTLLSTSEELSDEKVAENLGIFRTQKDKEYRTGRYAGYTWLRNDEREIIHDNNGAPCKLLVKPRFGLNITDMLNKIAEDEEFEDYLCSELPPGDRMFTFFFDDPLIEARESDMPNRIVSVWSYVILLKKVLERPLMSKMIRREQNFVGKVKGKIMFNKQLTKNILLGHEERIYCGYHTKSIDIPENQMIKYALCRAEQYILSRKTKKRKGSAQKLSEQNRRIMQYISICRSRLMNVSDREFTAQEIDRVQLPAMFRYYEPLLKLAKVLILEHNADISTGSSSDALIIPYAVNMPLLFECYCRKLMKEKLVQGWKMLKFVGDKRGRFDPKTYGCFYLDDSKSTYISGMIVPDIVLYNPGKNSSVENPYQVLDVKYKNPESSNSKRDDRLQLLAYAEVFGAERIGHIFPLYPGKKIGNYKVNTDKLYIKYFQY